MPGGPGPRDGFRGPGDARPGGPDDRRGGGPADPRDPLARRPDAPDRPLGPDDARRFRRLEDLRGERRETREGDRTIIREPGGRTIVRDGRGRTIIERDETERFRYGARDVRSERRGGETVVYIDRPDGDRIVTYLGPDGRLIRRSRVGRDGREIVIIDNRPRPGDRGGYFVELPPPVVRIPRERYILEAEGAPYERLYETITAPPVERIARRYTLDEIRFSPEVRARMPRVDLDTVTFDSGSWEVAPEQAQRLSGIARALSAAIARDSREVFLIEGHTDATGQADDNLSLSDRRAEAVAVVLQDNFHIPPENLTTQGYGAQQLKVPTNAAERANRRVTVRRITPLLTGDAGTSPPR